VRRFQKCRCSGSVVAFALMAAGVALAAVPVAHGVQAQVSASQARAVWEKWKQARAANPAPAAPQPGQPVFWLRVPSCKISTLVMQESDAEALHRYPAVRRLASGSSVILAHRDLHFRPLAAVQVRDEIRTESADGTSATYAVQSIRVLLPEQVAGVVDNPDSRDSLYLLTCYPFRYLGAAPQRFLVTATRPGKEPARR
jgi:sortase A